MNVLLEESIAESEKSPTPPWLWPNLLSLDAPIIAALWQGFLARRFSLPLHPAGRIVLFLTVWAIYVGDRLLDARQPVAPGEPARHRFYRRHANWMTWLLAAVTFLGGAIAILFLRPAVLREGLMAAAAVAVYLAAVHFTARSRSIPKEIAAALLFAGGTFLTAWAAVPCGTLVWAGLAFFVLCLANIIAIESWECEHAPHPLTRWLTRTYLLWVPATAMVCLLVGRTAWYESIALSAAACVGLVWSGNRLSLDMRRVMVDGVLLSPILFLLLR